MFNQLPKKTGIYHIKDGIENLELKVTFRHINSLLKLPKFDYNKSFCTDWYKFEQQQQEKENGIDTATLSNYNDSEVTEVYIKWQEKLFSAEEKAHFQESKNCINEIQKQYHDWLIGRAQAELKAKKTTEAQANLRRRHKKRKKNALNREEAEEDESISSSKPKHEIHTYVHEDNFQPSCKDLHIGRVEITPSQTDSIMHMYIYAKIDIDTQLVHLRWHPKEQLLYIYPDFNSLQENPYYIEIDKDYRHLYAYGVENISKARKISQCEDLSEYLDIPEIKPHWRTKAERSKKFMMPPQRTRRISILFELSEAYNFEYDDIHIRYKVHLPEHTIHEEGLLEASTHSSSISGSGVYRFGYNWQLTLLCEEAYDTTEAVNRLHIHFEVISFDSWERERIEGYAFLNINLLKPTAMIEHRLQCIRPVESFYSEVERFFIGGRRKFNFLKFLGWDTSSSTAPDDAAGAAADAGFNCRYGCSMKSTGFIKFSYQTFTQRNCDLLEPCKYRKTGAMTLDDIMRAYHGALKRLEGLSIK